MKKMILSLTVLTLWLSCGQQNTDFTTSESEGNGNPPEYAIILHGGAGYVNPESLSEEEKTAYYQALEQALALGEGILKDGGSSMDAVEEVIAFLEEKPQFNAGIGAVFTHEGRNELDASFMDGQSLNAGAVGGVTTIKSPIKAARAVMEKSKHVLLSGSGAEDFAISQGLDTVDNKYFFTQKRWDSLQRILREEAGQGWDGPKDDRKFGTVGCAALDKAGNLAAGTSTGGMTNKRYGRIGDSPIIGAGTYADNQTCAVSCTGHGEFFIRYAVAHDLSARMKYKGTKIQTAADEIIMQELKEVGGAGGLVAVDKQGNFAMPFNTGCMFRAYAKPGERKVAIWEE